MLMTAESWRKKTSSIFADRKNPLITDIDILLGEYHTPNKTDLQKLKLLILIRRYCSDWLSEKGDKKRSFRREYIAELRDQTEALLRGPVMQAAIQQRQQGGSRAMAGKQMQENVAETLQPRANAKQKFGLQATLPMNRVSAGFLEQKIEDYNGSHADQVDPHDLIATLDFAGSQNQKGKIVRNLEYLQKADRLKCQLQLWPDGRFHRGGHDIPHASPGGKELYAIDDMEYIYTSAQPAKAGTFHHSSFLSGKPVLCAGEITVAAGHVVHIDNLSGHYLPNTSYLLSAVEVLMRKYHVNLGQVTIMDMAQQGVEWRNAGEFLRLRGSPPIRIAANRRR